MHVAVLDLGTNTFNLVVAKSGDERTFTIVHSSKLPVKLGEGGINQGFITPEAFDRGIAAINTHWKTIGRFPVEKIMAFGTSALRTARNGQEFLTRITGITGIRVEIISGEREAELIYFGVRETVKMNDGKYLILDIGGGSNELIIADANRIYWKKSYNLGIARLLDKFDPSDPITPTEIIALESYLEKELADLFDQTREHGIKVLLGASGSFETFAAMILNQNIADETQASISPHSTPLALDDFHSLYQKLIHSTIEERSHMQGLEPMRIEMIVLASLFVKFIVEKTGIASIVQSNFSLKEGAIYELMKG